MTTDTMTEKCLVQYMAAVPAGLGPLHADLLVWAVVEIDGTVRDVVVGKSSGKPEVDALYVNAVRTGRFRQHSWTVVLSHTRSGKCFCSGLISPHPDLNSET